jgi:hypothetical protein
VGKAVDRPPRATMPPHRRRCTDVALSSGGWGCRARATTPPASCSSWARPAARSPKQTHRADADDTDTALSSLTLSRRATTPTPTPPSASRLQAIDFTQFMRALAGDAGAGTSAYASSAAGEQTAVPEGKISNGKGFDRPPPLISRSCDEYDMIFVLVIVFFLLLSVVFL